MREIKFRAWDPASGYMTRGNTLKGAFNKAQNEHFVWDDDVILMQYTGLKDKNGVDIYEGDILCTKNYGTNPPQIWEVVWSPNNTYFAGFGYKARNGIINSLSQAFTVTRDMEVIGNIWEA